MTIEVINAYKDVDVLYFQYGELSSLGDLSTVGAKSVSEPNQIIASVSPVLTESYQNAIVG